MEEVLRQAIDTSAVTAWLEANAGPVTPPLRFSRITGGNSNLTFVVTDAEGRQLVLRRPPLGRVLSSAHDMAREWRIVSALAGRAVPVPPVRGLCEDPAVTGAPFYVMDLVEGEVLTTPKQVEANLDRGGRRRVAEQLVDALVDLHELDLAEVGLEDLGRHEGYLERQLWRWARQLREQPSERTDRLLAVHDELEARRPAQGPARIVHGDYRLGNCLVAPDGTITAVLDWELCTLGDPLADLGYLVLDWDSADDPDPVSATSPMRAAGMPHRAFAAARYAERSGRTIEVLDVYVAFAAWRRACILEGVHARQRAGAMGAVPEDVERFVPRLLRYAEEAERRLEG